MHACIQYCRASTKHVHACAALQELDEVQAYILLRRWATDNPQARVTQHLGPEAEQALTEAYCLERACAINALELTLQHAEGGRHWQMHGDRLGTDRAMSRRIRRR